MCREIVLPHTFRELRDLLEILMYIKKSNVLELNRSLEATAANL